MDSKRTLREVIYKCAKPECKHTQTVNYFMDDSVSPVLHCVKCRGGFGTDSMSQMQALGKGMFPISNQVIAA